MHHQHRCLYRLDPISGPRSHLGQIVGGGEGVWVKLFPGVGGVARVVGIDQVVFTGDARQRGGERRRARGRVADQVPARAQGDRGGDGKRTGNGEGRGAGGPEP